MLSKFKINLVLVASAFIIAYGIFFIDNDYLNSLFIDYNDNLVINEVNIAKRDSNVVNVSFVNGVANLDKWVFPVSGNYTITTYYSSSHRAIDIYSYSGYGSSILAANNGTVITDSAGCYRGDVSCNGRRGNYVVINHNNGNYYTVYMHLAEIYVKVGDTVSAGDVIASMGNTGHVIPLPTSSNPYGGTHLHFCVFIGEPYKGGYAINPFNLY